MMLRVATLLLVVTAVYGCNWSEIYLSCSKDERVFADLSPSTASVSGLNVCKNEAQASGFSVGYDYLCPSGNCDYIYFQNLQDRPAGKYCHGYTSCNDFRFASLGGTHYQYNDNTRAWTKKYLKCDAADEESQSGLTLSECNNLAVSLGHGFMYHNVNNGCNTMKTCDSFQSASTDGQNYKLTGSKASYHYTLKGDSGSEKVSIDGGSSITLTTTAEDYYTCSSDLTIKFTNDGSGKDVVFDSDEDFVAELNGKDVSDGAFNWNGEYEISF